MIPLTQLNIKYGSDPLQFVNIYYPPPGEIVLGCIIRIHGGGWVSSDGPVPSFPSSTIPDNADVWKMASAGYGVVDVNYRDRTSGVSVTLPNNIDDIITVLSYCLDENAATAAGPLWKEIYDYIANWGGTMVCGPSAGGHLAIMGVCLYGTSSGKWPKAVVSMSGPLDVNVVQSTNYWDPYIVTSILDNYIPSRTATDRQLISPFYQYGTNGFPGAPSKGPWFDAVNASPCKFIFIQNYNDTLVPYENNSACIQSFLTYNPNTLIILTAEGPPKGDWDGFKPVTNKGFLTSTAFLPSSGQMLGDMYIINGSSWVYNNGNYSGDAFNPASVNGFTLWFSHNYTIDEYWRMTECANTVFKNLSLILENFSFQDKTVGTIISQQLVPSGGIPPYTFELVNGIIPEGLTIDVSSGVISGSLTTPGLYSYDICAIDANGAIVVKNFTMTVQSLVPVQYNPLLFPRNDSIFSGLRYPRSIFHSQIMFGNAGNGILGPNFNPISDSNSLNFDFSSKHIYVADEIWWGTGKPAGNELQALCDYWRSHGSSPGVGISPAAEAGYSGTSPVPTETIFADAIRCDWILLDPYLYTSSVPVFNNGDSTINQTSINNTIAGLINWTQGWIERLAPYSIPVILCTQGIRQPEMDESYVQQYLTAQYSTFNTLKICSRIVFPWMVLSGLEQYYFLTVDVEPYILAYQLPLNNQHYPISRSIRQRSGQLYPRSFNRNLN